MRADYAERYTSARDAIFGLLSDLGWHSHRELGSVGGNRYSARLLELKRLGYAIESRELEEGKLYRLASLQRGEPQIKRVKVFLTEREAEALAEGVPSSGARAAVARALASFRTNRERL